MEVIGAGFGRTGTLSMKAALEELGLVKCHHMLEVLQDPRNFDVWYEIAKGAPCLHGQRCNGSRTRLRCSPNANWF